MQFARISNTAGNRAVCGPYRFGDVGGGCRSVCLRGHVQCARIHVCRMLEDPGSKLSSCNFHALGSNYVSVAAAGTFWLPHKRLTLFSSPV